MQLPRLNRIEQSRSMIDVFRGYNHNLRIGEGEFYNMKNLSSNDYPVLSPRPKRGVYKIKDDEGNEIQINNPQGLIAKDTLCFVDGTDFIIGNKRVSMGLNSQPKTLVSMGAYVIIMPDKMYINTKDLTYGNIEEEFMSRSANIYLCDADGNKYENISTIKPSNPADQSVWIDTNQIPYSAYIYYESEKSWLAKTTYISIVAGGIDSHFEVGDSVIMTTTEKINEPDLVKSVSIVNKGDGYIMIPGAVKNAYNMNEVGIYIKSEIPTMDFIIESGNRLWGCRYGVANNGQVVNEIYASKLGDFKNWNCFDGISTDSYVASVGTDGQFTGAITHLGYPIFFKENCMHKVYGNYPANYQIETTTCRGVQEGCSKSLAIVNEVLYYKSQSSICYYDGSLPTEISSALGDVTYSNAVGGSLGNKYYVSMLDQSNVAHLFAYDTKKGMWHREDNTKATEFCSCKGDLYYIEGSEIKSILGLAEDEKEKTPRWSAETGIIGTDSPDKKYISRLDVRLSINIGARVYFYIQYDSSGEWEHVCTMTGRTLRSFAVPIRPRRCDHLRLRIDGDGETKIFSICKTIEQGSDM